MPETLSRTGFLVFCALIFNILNAYPEKERLHQHGLDKKLIFGPTTFPETLEAIFIFGLQHCTCLAVWHIMCGSITALNKGFLNILKKI